ncbi:MAG: uroporphyrinogen-III synthase [Hellea sp.]
MTEMQKPTVWITRTAPAAFKSAANWANAGYAAAVAPILEVTKPREMPALPVRDGVIIFTSGNAAKAFAQSTLLRHWPVVAVGYQTRHICYDLGFRDVVSSDGDSNDLTQLILRDYTTERPFFHCAGNHVRGTIVEDLKAKGYRAQRDLYYLSSPVKQMPKVDTTQMDFVAVYSPLAAKTLAGFAPDLTGATIMSISAATDAALGAMPCKARCIAEIPSEAGLLDALPAV